MSRSTESQMRRHFNVSRLCVYGIERHKRIIEMIEMQRAISSIVRISCLDRRCSSRQYVFFFVLLFCFLQNRSVINLRAEIERLLISKVVQIAKFKNLDLETLVTTVTDFQAIDFFMMTRSQRPFKKLLENLYSKCFPISY